MKMLSAEKWANSMSISVEEFNDYLKRLKYQIEVVSDKKDLRLAWHITERGLRHGRMSYNPFNQTPLWDIDAMFAVMKLRGKMTRKYFYCDDCGAFLPRQVGFEADMYKWVCKRCGVVNKLYYDPEDYV